MTRAATVTQIRGPRRATRLGPKEARQVARVVTRAGVPRGTARQLLELLLRRADPRNGYVVAEPRRPHHTHDHEGMTIELDASRWALSRASRALHALELVHVRPGRGREWTTYTLNVARIAELLTAAGEPLPYPWVNNPVPRPELPTHPGESPGVERVQNAPSEGAERTLPGGEVHPQRVQEGGSKARAHTRVRESDHVRPDPPTPATVPTSPPAVGDLPPAGGRGPLSLRRCPHGRTEAQGGCRQCGTTQRDQARVAAEVGKAERVARSKAEQLEHRRRYAEDRAAAGAVATSGAARARALSRGESPPAGDVDQERDQ